MKRLLLLGSLLLAACGPTTAGTTSTSGSATSATAGSSHGATTGRVTTASSATASSAASGTTGRGSSASTSSAGSSSTAASSTGSSASSASASTGSTGSTSTTAASSSGSSGSTSTTAASSGGSSGTAGGSGSTGGCGTPSDCPGTDTFCQARTCTGGVCGVSFTAPNTALPNQTPGTCQKSVCDGAGNVTSIADNNNAPTSSNPCVVGSCSNGAPGTTPARQGTACSTGGTVCDGNGACVGCNFNADCATQTSGACVANTCQAPTCSDGIQNQGETGVDCGGPCAACPVVLVIATSVDATGSIAASFDGGAWAVTAVNVPSSDPPTVTLTTSGLGVAAIRYTKLGDALDQAVVDLTFDGGAWSSFSQLAPGVTTRAGPWISSESTSAQLVFQGTDYKHYFSALSGGAWSAVEAVGGSTNQSYGPTPASIAALGSDALVGFEGGNQHLYAQSRSGGVWGAASDVGTIGSSTNVTALHLTGGVEDALLAFVASNGAIFSAVRISGSWSAPAAIASAFTDVNARLSATQLDDGSVALTFRGNDGRVYLTHRRSGSPWDAPTAVPPSTFFAKSGTDPVVSRGLAPVTAELVAVDSSSGSATHVRITATSVGLSFSAPVTIGGSNLSHVAITKGP